MAVYFIQSEGTYAVKIGVSVNPEERLAALQTANGEKLVLLGTTTEHSENSLHARFKSIRLNGEWFKPDPPLCEFLAELGITPIKKRKRSVELDTGHPFWGASRLFAGEWYDEEDIDVLMTSLQEDYEDAVDGDEGAGGALKAIEDMCLGGEVNGVIFNEETRIICVVFQRDVFGRRAAEIRDALAALFWALDDDEVGLAAVSWTETGGFRQEAIAYTP